MPLSCLQSYLPPWPCPPCLLPPAWSPLCSRPHLPQSVPTAAKGICGRLCQIVSLPFLSAPRALSQSKSQSPPWGPPHTPCPVPSPPSSPPPGPCALCSSLTGLKPIQFPSTCALAVPLPGTLPPGTPTTPSLSAFRSLLKSHLSVSPP